MKTEIENELFESNNMAIKLLQHLLNLFNILAGFGFVLLVFFIFKDHHSAAEQQIFSYFPIDFSSNKILFLILVGSSYLLTFGLLTALVTASVHITELRNKSFGFYKPESETGWFEGLVRIFRPTTRFYVTLEIKDWSRDTDISFRYDSKYNRVTETIRLHGNCKVGLSGQDKVEKRFKKFTEPIYESDINVVCFRDVEKYIENNRTIGTINSGSKSTYLPFTILVSKKFFDELQNKIDDHERDMENNQSFDPKRNWLELMLHGELRFPLQNKIFVLDIDSARLSG